MQRHEQLFQFTRSSWSAIHDYHWKCSKVVFNSSRKWCNSLFRKVSKIFLLKFFKMQLFWISVKFCWLKSSSHQLRLNKFVRLKLTWKILSIWRHWTFKRIRMWIYQKSWVIWKDFSYLNIFWAILTMLFLISPKL